MTLMGVDALRINWDNDNARHTSTLRKIKNCNTKNFKRLIWTFLTFIEPVRN